jgi:putative transposase
VSAFVDAERGRFGVERICEALDVSASACYRRASGERPVRSLEDERLLELIREIHARNYFAYGSWRMWKALRRAGEDVGRGRVERLMRTNGIQGAKRREKPWRTTIPDPRAARRPDLVQRDFTASRPNALWCADFTYLRCWEGPVFFAFVIDVFSRIIVGWQFADHMRTYLVLDALRMALAQRGPGADVRARRSRRRPPEPGQYTSFDYSQLLDDHGLLASIGSVGDGYDTRSPNRWSTASRRS